MRCILKRLRIFTVALALLIILLTAAYATGGGTASDPLITLSYIKDTWMKGILNAATTRVDNEMQGSLDHGQDALDTMLDTGNSKLSSAFTDAVAQAVALRVAEKGLAQATADGVEIALKKGEIIVGTTGAGIVLTSGEGSIYGSAGSTVINITTGSTRTPGFAIRDGIYYMITADDGSGIEITSDSATAIIMDGCRVEGRYSPQYTRHATALSTLGLFMGSNKGFELEREPTRQEALIMLIRLLGEEKQALAFDGGTKFVDLTGWADGQKYIKYGEHMGYANGDSDNTFSQGKVANVHTYLTFVLRALGYDDVVAKDFQWGSTDVTLAVKIGLLTDAQAQSIAKTGFMRDHVALISYNALYTKMKNSENLLSHKLIADGVITPQQLDTAATLIK